MRISVVVITRNEEASIRRCLDSVSWADEVVVLDSGSTDRTVEICRERGARVSVTTDWPGFGPQKNRALDLATGEWVLSLDADEWVTAELAKEIRAVVAEPGSASAFRLPRLSSFCGRYMRHSGWWPDYVTRLFRRGKARFSDDLVHERLIVNGPVGRLKGTLLHESFGSLEEVLDKINRYSSLGAQQMAAAGRRGGAFAAALHALAAFVRTYFLKAGCLDGREGFMLAVSNAEGAYYKYVKLWLMQARANRER
ncbi:MAG TPA: glycosyltransferase family 2 protein [Burkholderiales bacterium]|jgi:glycosyltransferase involved in cell wall biosynthesis|nr:glycosyltransferase family 2 protein [Burkholderiales bacterium]